MVFKNTADQNKWSDIVRRREGYVVSTKLVRDRSRPKFWFLH